jgi:hypothetical protein
MRILLLIFFISINVFASVTVHTVTTQYNGYDYTGLRPDGFCSDTSNNSYNESLFSSSNQMYVTGRYTGKWAGSSNFVVTKYFNQTIYTHENCYSSPYNEVEGVSYYTTTGNKSENIISFYVECRQNYFQNETCPVGTQLNDETCNCEEIPECESLPAPSKDILFHFSSAETGYSDCVALENLGTYTKDGKNYADLECWADNCQFPQYYSLWGIQSDIQCPDGTIFNNQTGVCDSLPPEQDPCSEINSNSPDFDCDKDLIPNSQDIDKDGDEIPNEYDDKPLGSNEGLLNCQEREQLALIECNTNLNNLDFSCNTNSIGEAYVTKNICTPKELEKEPEQDPCNDAFDAYKKTCEAPKIANRVSCKHNGLQVINYDFECIEDSPSEETPTPESCRLAHNETFDYNTQSCKCLDGYSRNTFGTCWKNLDTNATAEQILDDQKKQDEAHQNDLKEQQSKEQTQENLDLTSKSTESLQNLENISTGIRKDLNTTNDLLKQLNDNLSTESEDEESEEELPNYDSSIEEMKLFISNLENDYLSLMNTFLSVKNLIDSGFDVQISTSTCAPITFSLFGKTITIDIFKYLSNLRPLVTFLLTSYFLYLAIKIYIKGLGFKNA